MNNDKKRVRTSTIYIFVITNALLLCATGVQSAPRVVPVEKPALPPTPPSLTTLPDVASGGPRISQFTNKVCFQKCPPEFIDNGLMCDKPIIKRPYNRKAFLLEHEAQCNMASEGRGCKQCGSMLFPRCKEGYKAFRCDYVCNPLGATYKRPHYGTEAKCNLAAKGGACEKCSGAFVPQCVKGYKPLGCGVCSLECPVGMKDFGKSCAKNVIKDC